MKFTKILDFIKINNYTEFNIVKGFCESISNKGGLFKMKKMKKMLALTLAFVLAVTILPMVGSKVEAATVGQNVGYYRWCWKRDGSFYSEKAGTPAVTMTTGTSEQVDSGYVCGAVAVNKKGYLWTSDYKNGVTVISQGESKAHEAVYKMSSDNKITFTAPCDGTIEVYAIPRSSLTDDVNLVVNGANFGETMTLPAGASTYADVAITQNWKYTWDVEEGQVDVISATKETGIAQISFIPSPVSALGASYRNATDEYTNGIRFGSTIDKTAIDYSKVTESGTLIARKTTMDSNSVTELTMDSVGTVCLKVVRTTYLEETDDVLNYAAAIVNIPAEKLDDEFVARSYVVIDGVTYYGAQMIDTWNSVKAKADAKVE